MGIKPATFPAGSGCAAHRREEADWFTLTRIWSPCQQSANQGSVPTVTKDPRPSSSCPCKETKCPFGQVGRRASRLDRRQTCWDILHRPLWVRLDRRAFRINPIRNTQNHGSGSDKCDQIKPECFRPGPVLWFWSKSTSVGQYQVLDHFHSHQNKQINILHLASRT